MNVSNFFHPNLPVHSFADVIQVWSIIDKLCFDRLLAAILTDMCFACGTHLPHFDILRNFVVHKRRGRLLFRSEFLSEFLNPVDTFFKLLKEKSTNKFCHKTRPTVWPEPISFSSFEKISNDFQKKWMFHRWQVYKMTHIFSTFPIFTWTLKSWTWRRIKTTTTKFSEMLWPFSTA